jgi:hypothetical protein
MVTLRVLVQLGKAQGNEGGQIEFRAAFGFTR